MSDTFVEQLADALAERWSHIQGRRTRLYSLEEAAQYLGLSEDAVMDLVKAGKLGMKRPTRKVQFDIADLDRFVDEL